MVLCSSTLRSFNTFRSSFTIGDKTKLHWFPGHMHKGLKVMQQKLRHVDCIIEVHDARIPLSGRNPNFRDTISGLRPHILVLNKVDLTDDNLIQKAVSVLQKDSNVKVIYTNCKNPRCKGVSDLITSVENFIINSNRHNRTEEQDLCAMIIGVPNVGKSSLINTLRNRFMKKYKAAPVGAVAGVTRSVGTKIKVSENPLIYIYDSPGILTPHIGNVEVGMKLALCGTFKDSEVGLINIADYLLYWFNKHQNYSYTSFFSINEPTDNIIEGLTVMAIRYNQLIKRKEIGGNSGHVIKPDLDKAAYNFITAFRRGTFGRFNLDSDFLL